MDSCPWCEILRGGIMPSIGMRDGRVDENKTNWLHSFIFFPLYF